MELLLLLLLLPAFWLIMLPRRLVGVARRHRFALAGIALLLLAGGWLGTNYFTPHPRAIDYAEGDQALREMLQ